MSEKENNNEQLIMKTARIQSIISLIIVIAIVCMQPRISFAADEKPSETAVTEKFSNEEIIGMVSLGLSDEVIIEKIRSTSTAKFDTSLAALKTLKDAKVSDAVIKEMVSPKTGTKAVAQGVANTAEAGVPGMPKEYAICYKNADGKWFGLVHLPSSGSKATSIPFGPTSVRKLFHGAQAPVQIAERKPIFYIRAAYNQSLTREWMVVKMEKRADRRELEVASGTIWTGSKSGTKEKDTIEVEATKISDKLYSIVPTGELGDAEYALMHKVGKGFALYDFGITSQSTTAPTK